MQITTDLKTVTPYTGARLRFNPFKRVSCRYGAPMGRHGDSMPQNYDGSSPLFIKHCGGDGTYDKGGAYWGHSKVYAVFTRRGDFCMYVENPREALAEIAEAIA